MKRKIVGNDKPASTTAPPGDSTASSNASVPSSLKSSTPPQRPLAGKDVDRLPVKAKVVPTAGRQPTSRASHQPQYGRKGNPFANLPNFHNTPVSDRPSLLKQRLRACCTVYDFSDPTVNTEEKEAKRAVLLELLDYIQNTRACLTDDVMKEIVTMVSANIFRALPKVETPPAFWLDEEEEGYMEPAWMHLQAVYEFFVRVVNADDLDVKIARRYITHSFVLKLVDLFQTEDSREREYLKTLLHKIYGRIMPMRQFIRKSVQHFFFRFLYELDGSYAYGVGELLEIFGSVIHGFNLPLKDDHVRFLQNALIPLFRARSIMSFQRPLIFCLSSFLVKDPSLVVQVFNGLLRFWPRSNTMKETLFLCFVEDLLFLTQPKYFPKIMVPLFKRIALAINSPHTQVAERALFFWNNVDFVKIVTAYRQTLFPILIVALHNNTRGHWSQTIHTLNYGVLKLLMESDPPLFDDHFSAFKQEDQDNQQDEAQAQLTWREMMDSYPQEQLKDELELAKVHEEGLWPVFRTEKP